MKKFIVLLAVIAMVGAFTATAIADVSLYGSARFRTYYADNDFNPPADSNKDLEWRIGHLTRFGANFKGDKINGKFEMDARAIQPTGSVEKNSGASSVGHMRLRQLWGQYDFGTWKFMIGQNYPLFDAPVSGINYYSGGLQKFGGIGYGVARTSQMRFTVGNFRAALLTPDTAQGGVGTYSEVNTLFPKLELRYDMKMDAFALNFIGGYQSYEIETATNNSEDVASWALGARGKANFGPAYVGLSLNYRQNGKDYGVWTTSTTESAIQDTDGQIKDAKGWGFVAAVGWKLNDMFTLEASYASLSAEQDTIQNNEDDRQAWGVIAKITMAPGFYIVPELVFQDNKDTTTNGGSPADDGDATIFGVFWRIDFK
jgi:hypothetical protein